MMDFQTVSYRDGTLRLLDQTRLPRETAYVDLKTVEDIARAIERMVVRGAPAIGVTAAYGMAIAKRQGVALEAAYGRLFRTRPTAVNLLWALDRLRARWLEGADAAALEALARAIHQEDIDACRRIGELGAALIPDGAVVLTHCNAGALATTGIGTALGVIRAAVAQGKQIRVIADETRPWLQGARLTAWELMQDGIDVTVIADGAAAHLFGRGEIACAIVGADRIVSNGDVVNKVGTRGVAGLCRLHDRPFYVAAPWSTVDLTVPHGQQVPIEERPSDEVTHIQGTPVTPVGAKVRNPAFDVTPAEWVTEIVTERGRTGGDIARQLASFAREGRANDVRP